MLFRTLPFALFFVAVFAIYWLALLVCGSAFLDYLTALALETASHPRLRRTFFALSLFVNIGILIYFKYANFFLQSLQATLPRKGGEQ